MSIRSANVYYLHVIHHIMVRKKDALPGLPHPGCPLSSNSGVAFLANRATRSSSDCTNSYTAYIRAMQMEMNSTLVLSM